MKQILTFLSLLSAATILQASSLQVYQDGAIYVYKPKSDYLGITSNITATCKEAPLALQTKVSCDDSDDRLCQEFNALLQANDEIEGLTNNIKLLDQILSLHQPKTLDAQTALDTAKKISTEKTKLESQLRRDKLVLDLKEKAFVKQTSAELPLYYKKACQIPVKLKLQYGLIYFNGFYEADLSKKGEVKVTHYLAVTNRSGIDIVADNATFYNRMANRTVRPVHFNPWIVSEYQPRVPRPKLMMAKKSEMMMEAPAPAVVSENAVPVPMAEYTDAREYTISNLRLPSTGEPVNVIVTSWNSEMECGLYVAPYASETVYEKCAFNPKTQIENNQWKLKKDNEVINDRAIGEYRDKTYNLYTKTDEDIEVTRKPIVLKEKDTGFFGNTIRKKDGYTVTITNKSDKKKVLTVMERIPTSTTEKIEVRLLSINTDKSTNYKKLKDGKIEINVELAPQESKKIEVLFEISYDKDTKVNY